MLNIRPISDHIIVLVSTSIGLISLPVKAYSLHLTLKMWTLSARHIAVVSVLLQLVSFSDFILLQFWIIYMAHSFHTAVLFIPFLYARVGGGYCIGLLCEPNYVSFHVNLIFNITLTVNLTGLFNLLILYRHQSFLRDSSPVKLGRHGIKVASVVLMAGLNILPFYQSFAQCARCDWNERGRNYGVLAIKDAIPPLVHSHAIKIDAVIVGVTVIVYMTFSVAVSVHICLIIIEYAKMITTGKLTTKITRTKQSLIQVATFGTFAAAPIALWLSLAFFEFEDDVTGLRSIIERIVPIKINWDNLYFFSRLGRTHSQRLSIFARFTIAFVLDDLSVAIHKGAQDLTFANQQRKENNRKESKSPVPAFARFLDKRPHIMPLFTCALVFEELRMGADTHNQINNERMCTEETKSETLLWCANTTWIQYPGLGNPTKQAVLAPSRLTHTKPIRATVTPFPSWIQADFQVGSKQKSKLPPGLVATWIFAWIQLGFAHQSYVDEN
uniref:G protein-coupled receptor n=1 Tax=Pristionchus pacificus TaxID=54126 RepID=A0A8R1UY41_PRIPA